MNFRSNFFKKNLPLALLIVQTFTAQGLVNKTHMITLTALALGKHTGKSICQHK